MAHEPDPECGGKKHGLQLPGHIQSTLERTATGSGGKSYLLYAHFCDGVNEICDKGPPLSLTELGTVKYETQHGTRFHL